MVRCMSRIWHTSLLAAVSWWRPATEDETPEKEKEKPKKARNEEICGCISTDCQLTCDVLQLWMCIHQVMACFVAQAPHTNVYRLT